MVRAVTERLERSRLRQPVEFFSSNIVCHCHAARIDQRSRFGNLNGLLCPADGQLARPPLRPGQPGRTTSGTSYLLKPGQFKGDACSDLDRHRGTMYAP